MQKDRWGDYKNAIIQDVLNDLYVKRWNMNKNNSSNYNNNNNNNISNNNNNRTRNNNPSFPEVSTKKGKADKKDNKIAINSNTDIINSNDFNNNSYPYKRMLLRDSLPDYMSMIKSEEEMIAEEQLAELSPNSNSKCNNNNNRDMRYSLSHFHNNNNNNNNKVEKVKEVHLDNMFLCDNQSQYVEFWQKAAILKLNLRSARGDDEYIDMQVIIVIRIVIVLYN